MTTTTIARMTRQTVAPAPLIIATAELHKLDGNARPHFSLTGEEHSRRWSEPSGHDPIRCGAMGDELAATWPDLAPLNALHLSDDRGVPLHAVENGLCWLGFTEDRYGRPQVPREVVARHFRISEDDAEALHGFIGESPTQDTRRAALADWCADQAERWDAEARAALAIMGAAARVLNPEGVTVHAGTADECWLYVQRHQGQSVDWATTHGGWSIEPTAEAAEVAQS